MHEEHAAITGDSIQQQSIRSVEFLDEESAHAIQWTTFWTAFHPITPYGRREKGRLKPFLPGQEAAWLHALHVVDADLRRFSADEVRRDRAKLDGLADIQEALSVLAGHTALSQKQVLALKQFARQGLYLAADGGEAWTEKSRWERLLSTFGGDGSSGFALDHVADEAYTVATAAYTEALSRLTSERQQQDSAWRAETNLVPNRDSEIVVPLPSGQVLRDALKQDARLRWLRDTPFESVFRILPTTGMEYWAQQVDERKRHLDAAGERLLAQLTEILRADAAWWEAAVADVTAWDLRLARVDLALRWDGCVPGEAAGEQMALQGAQHPFVAARLEAAGEHYVPLDFQPKLGANVLSGSNMGGKTVAMTLWFVCQVLAQYGLPVPARSFSTRLFRIARFCQSSETDLDHGLSSFGREMVRVHRVWRELSDVGSGTLCFDEPGRSTNPLEGEAIVISLLQRSQRRAASGALVMVATHFGAALQVAGTTRFRVRGLRKDVLNELKGSESISPEERVRHLAHAMDYRIEPVVDSGAVPSEALTIAEWLGLQEELLTTSREYLSDVLRAPRRPGTSGE